MRSEAFSLSFRTSGRSSIDTLDRQLKAAELELQIEREHRLEEEANDARLAQLERQLKEEKRKVQAKRIEWVIQEEIKSLRLTEAMIKGTDPPGPSSCALCDY